MIFHAYFIKLLCLLYFLQQIAAHSCRFSRWQDKSGVADVSSCSNDSQAWIQCLQPDAKYSSNTPRPRHTRFMSPWHGAQDVIVLYPYCSYYYNQLWPNMSDISVYIFAFPKLLNQLQLDMPKGASVSDCPSQTWIQLEIYPGPLRKTSQACVGPKSGPKRILVQP